MVTAGQVLFTLTKDFRNIELHARIDEADVGRIAPGQAASFGFGAYPGRTFQGHVAAIRKMPQIAEGIVTYVAVIVANNDQLLFLPGMTAESALSSTAETTYSRFQRPRSASPRGCGYARGSERRATGRRRDGMAAQQRPAATRCG